MEMQITLKGTNWKDHSEVLFNLGKLLAGKIENEKTATPVATMPDVSTAEETSEINVSKMKKATAPKETKTETSDFDLGDTETEEAPKKKTYTLESDIIPAFQVFAKKYSREKAGKVLAKYKVQSVRDLPTAKFPEILKLLSV